MSGDQVISIVSWNVNSIRAMSRNLRREYGAEMSLSRFLANGGDAESTTPIDILCVQETKIDLASLDEYEATFRKQDKDATSLRRTDDAFDSHWAFCETTRGYCGVATFVRRGLLRSATVGFGFAADDEALLRGEVDNFVDAGRVLITDHDAFVLFNCYFPNTGTGGDSIVKKQRFQRSVERRAAQFSAAGRRVVVIGDVNIVPQHIDTTSPSKVDAANSHCYLPVERDWLSAVLRPSDEGGSLHDAFRVLYPTKENEFTFENRMRIDLALLNASTRDVLHDCRHWKTRGSDHTPFLLQLKITIDIPEDEQLLLKPPKSIKSFFGGGGASSTKRTVEAASLPLVDNKKQRGGIGKFLVQK